jgi:hypothetical protein
MRTTILSLCLSLTLSVATAAATVVSNGNFANGLTGWTTSEETTGNVVTSPSSYVTVEQGAAVLTTPSFATNIAIVSLSQFLTLPAATQTLYADVSFTMLDADPGSPNNGILDHLQVSWSDDQDSAFDRIFLDIDLFGPTFLDSLAGLTDLGIDGWRLTADISGLASRQGIIYFDLFNEDDGLITFAAVDNVAIAMVPEPGTLALLAAGAVMLLLRRKGVRHG